MKTAIAFGLLVVFGATAHASLTPYQDTRAAPGTHLIALDDGSVSAQAEHDYFQAPQPQAAREVGRCTVQIFVFTKVRLAQACH